MKYKTKEERALSEELARRNNEIASLREEYGRFDRALDELMRAVLLAIASQFSHPTSIASARLIEAVWAASLTIHTRKDADR